jgi:tRNA-(ms[2]io[6]A)-hydroxylase
VRLDLTPTPSGWADAALDDVEGLLSDHAHCEKKAATTALNFLQHHGDRPAIALRLARLAEQEANHLRRVLEHMARLGLTLRPDTGNDYARALVLQAHDPVDRCIAAACIEERSHERLTLLRDAIALRPDLAHLVDFFDELRACEAGHTHTYLDLACELRDEPTVLRRLPAWIEREAAAIGAVSARPAVH